MPPAVIAAIIGGGAAVAGSAISAHGAGKAADKQSDSADKALAVAKEQYDLERADNAPYRALGLGALGQLQTGMGYPTPAPQASQTAQTATSATPAPYVVPGAQGSNGKPFPGANPNGPQEVPNPPGLTMMDYNATWGNPKSAPWWNAKVQTQSSYTRMQSPDGRIVNVPQAQVAEATQRGGKVVS